MLFVSTSWGNDSVALVQWLHEHEALRKYERVVCVYANTGWSASNWPERVALAESVARSYGFETHVLMSMGFVPLARLKKSFPRNGMQFCTEELKVKPLTRFMADLDPEGDGTCASGIRREESRNRASWPGYVEESENHGGRSAWFPLVRVQTLERDALITRFGFDPLPHRSRECYPCINSNRRDLRLLTEDRIAMIETLEANMGHTSLGKPRTLFRPYRHAGATGIREVVRWANSERGKYEPDVGCDSGFCGD